jgi:hypothetical protein
MSLHDRDWYTDDAKRRDKIPHIYANNYSRSSNPQPLLIGQVFTSPQFWIGVLFGFVFSLFVFILTK